MRGGQILFHGTVKTAHETYLDTVNVRLDVASLVQIQNVYRPKELTPLRKCYRSNTIQEFLTHCPPTHTLGLTVPMNSLHMGEMNTAQIKSLRILQTVKSSPTVGSVKTVGFCEKVI